LAAIYANYIINNSDKKITKLNEQLLVFYFTLSSDKYSILPLKEKLLRDIY